jgi:3-oxoacyl-[acyl-carrier protein] reductase
MRTIRGRRAVITGAASGIGRSIALALATEGAALFLIDRDAEGLNGVKDEARAHGVDVFTTVCNLEIPEEISAAIAQVRATWNENIHILANCAGTVTYGPLHLTSQEAWRQVLAVNLLAPIQIVHQLLPILATAEEAHILNVCSMAGLVPMRRLAVYQASKYGLVGFTLALRTDYYRANLGITALCPGFVRTPLVANLKDLEAHRQPRLLPDLITTTPQAVARSAIAAIRRDRGLVVVTPLARLLWWAVRTCPPLYGWLAREGWRRRGKIEMNAQTRLRPPDDGGAPRASP